MIFFAGRGGDVLTVDGQRVGALPARTVLTEGSHTFTLSGEAGEFSVTREIVLAPDGQTAILHLDE